MINQSNQSQENQGKGKGKKSSIVIALLLLLAVITIGYASLSATLNINGTPKIKDNTWEVGPAEDDPDDPDDDPIVCPSGEVCTINPTNPEELEPDDGVKVCTDPDDPNTCNNPVGAVIWTDGNTVYFKHVLTEPGDVFTFTTKFTNTGSIDAKVASVTKTLFADGSPQKKFLTYDVTYADGTAVGEDDYLAAGTSHTFKVTVKYRNDINALPTTEEFNAIKETTTLFTVNYEQA